MEAGDRLIRSGLTRGHAENSFRAAAPSIIPLIGSVPMLQPLLWPNGSSGRSRVSSLNDPKNPFPSERLALLTGTPGFP